MGIEMNVRIVRNAKMKTMPYLVSFLASLLIAVISFIAEYNDVNNSIFVRASLFLSFPAIIITFLSLRDAINDNKRH